MARTASAAALLLLRLSLLSSCVTDQSNSPCAPVLCIGAVSLYVSILVLAAPTFFVSLSQPLPPQILLVDDGDTFSEAIGPTAFVHLLEQLAQQVRGLREGLAAAQGSWWLKGT
jgi:hypothetical protein